MASRAGKKTRSAQEIRAVVKLAQSHFEKDHDKQTHALRNPVSYLCSEPYKLTLEEIVAAYDDSTLNIAHPEHPDHSKLKFAVGCILCG